MAKKTEKPKKTRRPPPRPKPSVNPDSILELVKVCGGYAQAAEKMAEKGIVNPSSGKPYSKHTIKRFTKGAAGWEEHQKSVKKDREQFGDRVDALLEEVKAGDQEGG